MDMNVYGDVISKDCHSTLQVGGKQVQLPVVVAAKTEETLQAYRENVTCANENPLAKSE